MEERILKRANELNENINSLENDLFLLKKSLMLFNKERSDHKNLNLYFSIGQHQTWIGLYDKKALIPLVEDKIKEKEIDLKRIKIIFKNI